MTDKMFTKVMIHQAYTDFCENRRSHCVSVNHCMNSSSLSTWSPRELKKSGFWMAGGKKGKGREGKGREGKGREGKGIRTTILIIFYLHSIFFKNFELLFSNYALHQFKKVTVKVFLLLQKTLFFWTFYWPTL